MNAARWLLLALAILGVIGVAPIAYRQFADVQVCPSVGVMPACYVVLVGYALIAISAVVERRRLMLFAIGWLPIFALAATGTSLELFGRDTCPTTDGGTPTCFISLAMVSLLAIIYLVERRLHPSSVASDLSK